MRINSFYGIKAIERAYLVPWKKGSLLLSSCVLTLFISIFVVPSALIHTKMGSSVGLYFLFLYLIPVFFYGWYRFLRKKMDHLRSSLPDSPAIIAEGLFVHGMIQTPAIIYIMEDNFAVEPLVGSRISIPLPEVKIIKESSWFNGTWYPGQIGFWLQTSLDSRIGFIVPDGDKWKPFFER